MQEGDIYTISVTDKDDRDNTITATYTGTLEFSDATTMSLIFVFIKEIEGLLKKGLIKGGDLDNAIVIYEKHVQQKELNHLADIMGIEREKVDKASYIMNKPLQYPNEPAKYKLLDVIGDIALVPTRDMSNLNKTQVRRPLPAKGIKGII